jgi:hypothetical protein
MPKIGSAVKWGGIDALVIGENDDGTVDVSAVAKVLNDSCETHITIVGRTQDLKDGPKEMQVIDQRKGAPIEKTEEDPAAEEAKLDTEVEEAGEPEGDSTSSESDGAQVVVGGEDDEAGADTPEEGETASEVGSAKPLEPMEDTLNDNVEPVSKSGRRKKNK